MESIADIIDRIEAEQDWARRAELQTLLEASKTPEEARFHTALFHVTESYLKTGGLSEALGDELVEAASAYYAKEHGEQWQGGHPSASEHCEPR